MLVKIERIKPNPNNPRRLRAADAERLKTSIAQFPQMLKVRGLGVVSLNHTEGDYEVLGGNQRLAALLQIQKEIQAPGFAVKYEASAENIELLKQYFTEGIPCEDCTFFTDDQRERFIVTDNLGYADWDIEAVRKMYSLESLETWGSEDLLRQWDDPLPGTEAYTRKVERPIYTPKGDQPEIKNLYDVSKYEALLAELSSAKIPKELRLFLTAAASRHIRFNYSQIAEFYCHCEPEIQRLFEASALVIIDFRQAIELGFVRLTEEIITHFKDDYADQ